MAKFVKGQSGNPAGRPPVTETQRQAKLIAKELAGEAMDTLAKWMRDPKNATAAVKACEAILDRADGKPAQEMKHSGSIGSYEAQPIPVEERNPLESPARPATNGHSPSQH